NVVLDSAMNIASYSANEASGEGAIHSSSESAGEYHAEEGKVSASTSAELLRSLELAKLISDELHERVGSARELTQTLNQHAAALGIVQDSVSVSVGTLSATRDAISRMAHKHAEALQSLAVAPSVDPALLDQRLAGFEQRM